MRRWRVDLYLSGEGPRAISRAVGVTHGKVCRIIRHYQTYGTYSPFSQGGRRNPSKLSENVLESIELFTLKKPIMFGREIRGRLLNDGVCNGGNLPALSTVNKGIKNKLCMSYEKLSVTSRESQSDVNIEESNEYLELTSRIDPCKLHFFDESSVVKTTVDHQYGHSFVGQRAIEVQHYASNANCTVNLLKSVRGIDYYNILIGPSNGDEVVSFFEYVLETEDALGSPILTPGDAVVMDNCGFHHGRVTERALRDVLEDAGAQRIFQPPYSPHLILCEFSFGQMKKHLYCDEEFSESFTEVVILKALRGAACKDRRKLEIESSVHGSRLAPRQMPCSLVCNQCRIFGNHLFLSLVLWEKTTYCLIPNNASPKQVLHLSLDFYTLCQ